jgi:hypothetical protein
MVPALAGLAGLLMDRGDAAAALPLLEEASALRRAAFPDDAWPVAAIEAERGRCLLALGRRDEAAPLLAAAEARLAAAGRKQ